MLFLSNFKGKPLFVNFCDFYPMLNIFKPAIIAIFLANRGEIGLNQNRGEAAVGVKNGVYTIWRDLLNEVRTYYQTHLCNETIPDFEEKGQ